MIDKPDLPRIKGRYSPGVVHYAGFGGVYGTSSLCGIGSAVLIQEVTVEPIGCDECKRLVAYIHSHANPTERTLRNDGR
jgi:hypothetical protein